MGFRFRRSFKIAPGVRLNLNSKSTSVRIGPKGFGYTISSNGKKRVTASIPGTGISYSEVASSAARARPTGGNHRRRSIWPVILVFLAVIAVIGISNSDSGGSPRTSISPPATRAPIVDSPPQITPSIVAEPSLAPAPKIQLPAAYTPPELRYVAASALNIRTAPNTSGNVIGTLPNGHQVSVLRRENGWLLVQSAPGTEGWISERYTSSTRTELTSSQPAQALFSAPAPEIDRDAIVQKIIERSIQNYSGSCPCPYNTMRNGRRCGGNSAYSKPGGRSPICFSADVTEAMIAAFRD
ncbi:DUF4236 domain-containing protein [Devosia submarina]|uniref:DUF4236 domain-containing protein n=1 Tax=Devosia submarina TaxID=1173082 RepID=UPI000D3D74EA|nr:DUF4236 domain-containing protein [Devosia submarina]